MEKKYNTANPIDYYDVIINVDSLMNLQKGWELKCSEQGRQTYDKKKKLRSIVFGIVGNGNKGKSFILQKLGGTDFPSGFSIKTEGLSIKYPTIKDKNIILLDSAGLETPLMDEDLSIGDIHDDNDDSEEKEQEENPKESLGMSEVAFPELQKEIDEYQKIQLLARDKQLTELFLQKFVISYSDILVTAVGQLTYSDQKLLNRIRKDNLNQKGKHKMLFIMHNLMNFEEVQQVKDYIKDTLKRSSTFKLFRNRYVNLSNTTDDKSKQKNQYYYSEIIDNKAGIIHSIVHLIMAREGTPAGDFYNETSLEFLRMGAAQYTNLDYFPILDKIKDYLVELSKDIIENPITKEDIEVSEKLIRLVNIRNTEGKPDENAELQLKKCFVDELGFSTFYNNGFIPNYRYYKEGDYFVIQIEIPGSVKTFKTMIINISEYYLFKFTGVKSIGEGEKKNCEYSSITEGNFSLDIRIMMSELNLEKWSPFKHEKKDGVITLYYKLGVEVKELTELGFD